VVGIASLLVIDYVKFFHKCATKNLVEMLGIVCHEMFISSLKSQQNFHPQNNKI
jgi:hypothetical protein